MVIYIDNIALFDHMWQLHKIKILRDEINKK